MAVHHSENGSREIVGLRTDLLVRYRRCWRLSSRCEYESVLSYLPRFILWLLSGICRASETDVQLSKLGSSVGETSIGSSAKPDSCHSSVQTLNHVSWDGEMWLFIVDALWLGFWHIRVLQQRHYSRFHNCAESNWKVFAFHKRVTHLRHMKDDISDIPNRSRVRTFVEAVTCNHFPGCIIYAVN